MTAALSLVVQHLGVSACPQCLTREQWLRCKRWMYVPVRLQRDELWEYGCDHADDCPAIAIARFSAACKATGVVRNQTEVQAHAQEYKERKRYAKAEAELDMCMATDAGLA